MGSRRQEPVITPEILLQAYAAGVFPMAESADDPRLFWVDPPERGIFPLDGLIVSKSLARTVRSDHFAIRVSHDFDAVISGCATRGATRGGETPAGGTWINARIRNLYGALFDAGFVHTVESWREGRLVGGLYGVCIGSAFFGESMFHIERDASKVALVHLVARLRAGGFTLLDTQFVTDHLATLGAVEIPRATYQARLEKAVETHANFDIWPREGVSGAQALAALHSSAQAGGTSRPRNA